MAKFQIPNLLDGQESVNKSFPNREDGAGTLKKGVSNYQITIPRACETTYNYTGSSSNHHPDSYRDNNLLWF
jgi:hypothetical protein